VCTSKSVYFQRIRAFVKVYRFSSADFVLQQSQIKGEGLYNALQSVSITVIFLYIQSFHVDQRKNFVFEIGNVLQFIVMCKLLFNLCFSAVYTFDNVNRFLLHKYLEIKLPTGQKIKYVFQF